MDCKGNDPLRLNGFLKEKGRVTGAQKKTAGVSRKRPERSDTKYLERYCGGGRNSWSTQEGRRRLKDIYLSVEEMTKRNNGLHPVTHGRHVENGSKKIKKPL